MIIIIFVGPYYCERFSFYILINETMQLKAIKSFYGNKHKQPITLM